MNRADLVAAARDAWTAMEEGEREDIAARYGADIPVSLMEHDMDIDPPIRDFPEDLAETVAEALTETVPLPWNVLEEVGMTEEDGILGVGSVFQFQTYDAFIGLGDASPKWRSPTVEEMEWGWLGGGKQSFADMMEKGRVVGVVGPDKSGERAYRRVGPRGYVILWDTGNSWAFRIGGQTSADWTRVSGVMPKVRGRIRQSRGPGPGWWRDRQRHAAAARRGWRRRR